MKRIYLDYAATTPVDPEVLRAMNPYFTERFGNPGSLHGFGQEAIAALDHSREIVARSIGAEFREIIFTSSATEANNLALRGVHGSRIIISAIEHESVLETARDLERDGVEVIYLPVDKSGVVDLAALKKSLNDRTVLVSIMYANNEIGTIQPIKEIAKTIRDFRSGNRYPLFHTDAVQAFQFLDCDVASLGVDLMTISSHKIYGPKGAAALYVRKANSGRKNVISPGDTLAPLITGGGQEYGVRSGTENIPAIVGFAKAVELVIARREKEFARVEKLRDELFRGIKKIHPKSEINGIAKKNQKSETLRTLPNILNVYFARDLLTRFDLRGLAVSSGSACRSRAMESSHVIEALGYSKERAKSSIRFSLGKPTTKSEIDRALKVMYFVLRG